MNPALAAIYGVVFLDVLGFTTLIPLLPALAQRYHVSATVVAAALSTSAFFATISSPFWGWLSDRFGRKIVLQCSQTCSLIGYAMIALSGNVFTLFLARGVSGMGGGNLGVAESYIADITEPQQREQAYAWSSAAFGAGFVLGPVIAGQFLKISLSAPFWLAVCFEIINLTVTQRFIRSSSAGEKTALNGERVREVLEQPKMLSLLVRQFLYIFSYTYFFGIFSLYVQRAIGLGPEWSSVLLGAAGAVGAVVLVIGADRIVKRYGERILVQGAFAAAFASFAALAGVRDPVTFVPVLVVWAAAGAALRPTLDTLISKEAPEGARGAMLGIADALNNASMVLGPVLAGMILERDLVLLGALPAVCCALAFLLGR